VTLIALPVEGLAELFFGEINRLVHRHHIGIPVLGKVTILTLCRDPVFGLILLRLLR